MKKRPDPRNSPQLKPFRVERARVGWVRVVCGNCRRPFYVRRGAWLHSEDNRRYVGRPCPYCYLTGRIPDAG